MTEVDRLWCGAIPRPGAGSAGTARSRRIAGRPSFALPQRSRSAVALDAAEADLWVELERLTPVCLERWRQIRDEGRPVGLEAARP